MPSWSIHNKWARYLGIDERIADEVNRRIDNVENSELHDYGRVIVNGAWIFDYLHSELSRYYNEVCGGYHEEFRSQCVGAFFLHHVLDYASTLLHAPSTMFDLSKAKYFVTKLMSNIAEDYRKRVDHLEIAQVAIRWCDEILRLIEERWGEIVPDIKPQLTEHVEWARRRLVKVKCLRCDREFTTVDDEGQMFLASMRESEWSQANLGG